MAAFRTILLVTTVAGLVAGLGAVPVILGARVSHRVYDAWLGPPAASWSPRRCSA